jgi:catechol 2,3-dioxygenase-like lactoylglutathione lyase family enzyme
MISTAQVNLYVEEPEVSLAFYRDRFGFTETFRTPESGPADHVEVRLEGLVLGFGSRTAAAELHGLPVAAEGEPPGPARAEVVLWCDDVDAEFDRLALGGVPVLIEPRDSGSNRVAWFLDPDGNPVGLVAPRG